MSFQIPLLFHSDDFRPEREAEQPKVKKAFKIPKKKIQASTSRDILGALLGEPSFRVAVCSELYEYHLNYK